MTSGTGMPHATVDALGHEPQHTRGSAPVVPGGLTQLSPLGHIEPKPLHMRQLGEGTGSPHATLPVPGQLAQHTPVDPPVHVVPAPQPPVPKLPHVRHTAPVASRTSGTRVPHGTVEGSAHAPQHVRSTPPPGRSVQVPEAQSVPVPVQVRQDAPRSSTAAGIGMPHATLEALAHPGQHASDKHSEPAGQRVPVPVQAMLPMQVSGTSVPQSTMSALKQPSVQVHTPATQVRPSVHGPSQRPPQPSESPHIASAAQEGMHSQRPVSGLHSSLGPGQGPVQKPPHPSGAPQAASAGQRGTHTQLPAMQRAGASHAGSQSHVATQAPF